ASSARHAGQSEVSVGVGWWSHGCQQGGGLGLHPGEYIEDHARVLLPGPPVRVVPQVEVGRLRCLLGQCDLSQQAEREFEGVGRGQVVDASERRDLIRKT
ncbi:MAG: hypothetical protein Q8P60_02350, partial [Pseudorhodobacter sp.]|nr:hypothetical protein [Pseudorhodobacter sp.]